MNILFRNNNFKLLFAGNLVSELGNALFGFAAGVYVTILTDGSPILVAMFMALGAFVRLLFSPVAGVLVDRWDKVKIIYITDYMRGIMFLALAYVFFVGVDVSAAITILLTMTVVSGLISAFFGPAITAATPEIVGLDQVQQANGANGIIQSLSVIIGAILGAVALEFFDFHIALLLNGISFMLSGFSEMFIKAKFKTQIPDHEPPHMLEDMKVGFKYIKEKEGLLRMMIYSLFLNFSFAPLFSVAFSILFIHQLKRSPMEYAWISIAFGIAMMFAGVIVGGTKFKSLSATLKRSLFLLTSSFILIAINIFLLESNIIGFWTFYGITIVLQVALAVFMMSTNIPLQTAMVKVINPELRGKVFSTIGAISGGAMPLAMVMAGAALSYISVSSLALILGVLCMVPTAGFLFDNKVQILLDGMNDDAKLIDENMANESTIKYDELAEQG